MDAFVFPGQGSQYSGMGKNLAENFNIASLVFEEANDVLGFDILLWLLLGLLPLPLR